MNKYPIEAIKQGQSLVYKNKLVLSLDVLTPCILENDEEIELDIKAAIDPLNLLLESLESDNKIYIQKEFELLLLSL